ncbi:MAG: hypothetical protein HKP27_00010 [Myxococcales bacterium]|nr:hypothetical protein [Myxococcales bacterium]
MKAEPMEAALFSGRDLDVGSTDADMLAALGGPAWVAIPGRDRSRLRVVSTLLHGNEPSGFRAIGRFLRSEREPATDLLCFFGSVRAARIPPGFANRTLPSGRDLNRCFKPPFCDAEGHLACEVLERLRERPPEALVDLHNTSGRGPAYGVLMSRDRRSQQIAALWSRHAVVTDLRLGALTEATTERFPSAVVECGGRDDPAADRLAWYGLRAFAERETLFDGKPTLELFEHPVRIEVCRGYEIAYAAEPVAGVDITLYPDLDRYNFGVIDAGEAIGWLGPRGLSALQLHQASGVGSAEPLLTLRSERLVAAHPFRPLMITTQPEIAKSDCLFYAVPTA